MRTERTSVLVVGGGLVGLSTAMLLAARGVPTICVDKHPSSSPHPRAVGFTARTMEIFRSVELADRIPPAPKGATIRRQRVESLAGRWFEELPWPQGNAAPPTVDYSPCGGAGLAQDRLEPLLRDRARELGADVRMSTRLLSFDQDTERVRAVLRSPEGAEYAVEADYLVGADGHRSPVRTALGIERDGRGFIAASNSILFRAPLQEYLESGIGQFVIDQPGLSGFLTTYGDGRWVFFLHDEPIDDEQAQLDLLRRAIGREVDIELITIGRWQVTAAVARDYRSGRVFLAGDAAHTLPPSRGGYGANTGIEDAHNLVWKLAAVLTGESGDALLDTYEAERRPVAQTCHDQIFAREEDNPAVALIDDQAMQLGQLYRSAAVIGATEDLPPAKRPDAWSGQPGTRAPHLWLDNGTTVSTLDLFGPSWVLLSIDPAWRAAAERADLRFESLTGRVDPVVFGHAFGLGATGAALVRPDGYLAWRAADRPLDPTRSLNEALATVRCAPSLVS